MHYNVQKHLLKCTVKNGGSKFINEKFKCFCYIQIGRWKYGTYSNQIKNSNYCIIKVQ